MNFGISTPPSPVDRSLSSHLCWVPLLRDGPFPVTLIGSQWGVASLSEPPPAAPLGVWRFHSEPPHHPAKLGELGTGGR